MKVEWIDYKGKKILLSDYSGLNADEMVKQFKYETDIILQQNQEILYLANFANTVITPDLMRLGNELGKKTKPFVKKSAVYGITGMKSVLMNTFNMITGIKARAFENETKAKEYLITTD